MTGGSAWSWLLARPEPTMTKPRRRIITIVMWLGYLAAFAGLTTLTKHDLTVAAHINGVVLCFAILLSVLVTAYLLFQSPVVRRKFRRR